MPFSADFSGQRPKTPEEYGRFQQHLALLQDERRLRAYADAIALSGRGKVAVDIGSGSGVLAFLALRHGYKEAWLIEPSDKMLQYSRYVAKINGIENRCHFIHSTAEDAHRNNQIPTEIDLVITETISSVIVGFGSWDALPMLIRHRLSPTGKAIPARGTLRVRLTAKNYHTRGYAGLSLLAERGIKVDLASHTFCSGGNVLQKWKVNEELRSGPGPLAKLIEYDCRAASPLRFITENVPFEGRRPVNFGGMLIFWEMQLDEAGSIVLAAADPELSSWCPYYVPFTQPIYAKPGDILAMSLNLLDIDSPFPYAIQFCNGGKPVTEVLYW